MPPSRANNRQSNSAIFWPGICTVDARVHACRGHSDSPILQLSQAPFRSSQASNLAEKLTGACSALLPSCNIHRPACSGVVV